MTASVLHISRMQFEAIRRQNDGVFDLYTVHKLVYSLFPRNGDAGRDFLFLYAGGSFTEKQVLVLSQRAPVPPDAAIATLESKVVPEAFLDGDYYGFTVQMNPARRDSRSGRIVPVRGKDALLAWFTEKAPSFGFTVQSGSLSVGDTDVVQFAKDGRTVTLGKAVFTGRMKVVDRRLFKRSFASGLGKGKAFGFGLLQVVPLAYGLAGAE